MKARSGPSRGYMNRLKIYWGELYPELANFNAKQLRQQATFTEKNNLHLTETNNRNGTPRNATAEVSNSKTIDRSQPTEEVTNVIEQNNPPLITNNMKNDNNNELINHLRERFTENFNTLKKPDITARVFLTKVVRKPNDDIIHAIKTVAEERMLMLEQTPSYIDINNIYICSHRQYVLNIVQENENQRSKKTQKNDGLSTWKRKLILLDEGYHMCTL